MAINEDVAASIMAFLRLSSVKRCSRVSRTFQSAAMYCSLWKDVALKRFGPHSEVLYSDRETFCTQLWTNPDWYRYYQTVMQSPYRNFIECQRAHEAFVEQIVSSPQVRQADVIRSSQQHFSPRSASAMVQRLVSSPAQALRFTNHRTLRMPKIKEGVSFFLQIGDFGEEYLWPMVVLRRTPYSLQLSVSKNVGSLPEDWGLISHHIDSLTVWAVCADFAEPDTLQQQEGFGGVVVYKQINPYSDPRKSDYLPGWDFFLSALSQFGGVDISTVSDGGESRISVRISIAVSTIAAAIGDHVDRCNPPAELLTVSRCPLQTVESPLWPMYEPLCITADRLPLQLHLELYDYNCTSSWSQIHAQLIPAQFMCRHRTSRSRSVPHSRQPKRLAVQHGGMPRSITLEAALDNRQLSLPNGAYQSGLGLSMWVTDANGKTMFGVPFCKQAKCVPAVNPGGNSIIYYETHLYDVHVPTTTLAGGHHNVLTLHVRPPLQAAEPAAIRMIRISLNPVEAAQVMGSDCWLLCCEPEL